MKHHKVKGVWRHRPDAVPLPDSPSTGAKRKKRPLERLSKKHLWDKTMQALKEVLLHSNRVRQYSHMFLSAFACKALENECEKLSKLVLELERRMD